MEHFPNKVVSFTILPRVPRSIIAALASSLNTCCTHFASSFVQACPTCLLWFAPNLWSTCIDFAAMSILSGAHHAFRAFSWQAQWFSPVVGLVKGWPNICMKVTWQAVSFGVCLPKNSYLTHLTIVAPNVHNVSVGIRVTRLCVPRWAFHSVNARHWNFDSAPWGGKWGLTNLCTTLGQPRATRGGRSKVEVENRDVSYFMPLPRASSISKLHFHNFRMSKISWRCAGSPKAYPNHSPTLHWPHPKEFSSGKPFCK